MTYEELLIEADKDGLIVKEKNLLSADGRIKNHRVAIRKNFKTSVEKSCVLAEEMGHHHTTVGDILDQDNALNRKQELKARLWGYDKKIGLLGIIKSFERGCQSKSDMADYLDVTEEYLEEAINCYRSKYGTYVTIDRSDIK